MLKKNLLLTVLLGFTTLSLAQDLEYDELHEEYNLSYRTFRVALFPPLSTNGIDAASYASKYSLNILAGYNGALDRGFELGGLLNLHRYYAHGGLIAGIGNYAGREMSGIHLAGLFNYSGEELQGIQLSGLLNMGREELQGIQITGGLNWAGDNAQGLQFSSLLNYAGRDMQGLFAAGIGNVSLGNMQGLLFSGLLNYSGGDMQGIAASGGLNYAREMQGITLASVNYNQMMQGMQVGAVNIADEVQGIQIGVINYAREMEGAPVGLISYYGNGRKNIDLWTSDAGFANFGIKLGTPDIYNMVSIGFNPAIDRDIWQVGWSIGRKHEYDSHFLYTDFSFFKINEGGWTKDLNSLFKYRLQFGKEVLNGMQIYGGPSLNMLISRVPGSSDYTWYRLFDFGAKGRDYIFWIGYSFGFELL